jgi:uncharacterized protein (TIGR02246 family)
MRSQRGLPVILILSLLRYQDLALSSGTTVRHSSNTRRPNAVIIARMFVASLVAILLNASQTAPPPVTPDHTAVEAATQAYREAWLSNDAQRIMNTLTLDAVLYPSSLPPIVGRDAIRRFWFSPSSPTRVVAMELSVDSVHLDGDTAVASGMGSLTFVVTVNGVDGAPRTLRSWHVNVLRRQRDGSWLIWKRMWGDLR